MSHRRARHLNPNAAGATLVYDARFISGANGSAIATWSNRASASYDMVQSSASQKPILRYAQQAGNNAAEFNGATDATCSAMRTASAPSIPSATSIIIAGKITTSAGQDRNAFYWGNAATYSPNYNYIGVGKVYSGTKLASGNYNNPTDGSVVATSSINTSNSVIATGIVNDSGTNRMCINGTQEATTSSTTISFNASTVPTLGTRGTQNGFAWLGYLYTVIFFPAAITAAMRHRIEQSLSRVWKISCS